MRNGIDPCSRGMESRQALHPSSRSCVPLSPGGVETSACRTWSRVWGMPGSSSRPTLSIGLYPGISDLCRPIGSLLDLGIDLDQIGLVSTSSNLNGAIRPSGIDLRDWRHVAGLLAAASPVTTLSGMPQIVATPNLHRARDGLASWLTTTGADPSRVHRISPSDNLASLIRAGHSALTVTTSSNDQQRRSVRVLLASSPHPVETHDYRTMDD